MNKTADVEIPADFIEEIKKADEYLRYPDIKIAFRSGAEWAYKKLFPGMGWIKARDQKPEPYTDVMIRNENDHLLFTLGRNAEHLEEWSTEDSNTWFFDDTEWLYEPSPAQ